MITVLLVPEAQDQLESLPTVIKARVLKVLDRLQDWPNVSGAKPLRKEWSGHHRIRTGDYRIVFKVITPHLIVVRIQHRSEVYED